MNMKRIKALILVLCLLGVGANVFNSCEGPNIDTDIEDAGGTEGDGNGDGEGGNGEGEELPDREPEGPDAPRSKDFVILFTNDFHSQIEPISKDETYNADRGGIKRIKVLVDSVRAAEPSVLLADAGDLVQGTYYFSLLNGVVEMMALEELRYDVRTIGNHEFDKKMSGLEYMQSMSTVPVVASNYDFSMTNLVGLIHNSIIIQSGYTKVGFIGMNVMLRNLVDPTACEGVEWQNAINVADIEAKKLRDEGADIVIALSHLGYRDNDVVYYDRGIALNTRHIDMIIGGHSHTFLNKADYVTNLDGDKVPIVQTGSRGVCLGYAKITFDENDKPSFSYRLIPVDNRLDSRIDKEFSDIIDSYSAEVKGKMDEVIGYCPRALRKGYPESRLGNLTADGLVWMAEEYWGVKADIGLYNSGGIRAEFSEGDLTIGDIYAVYPFDNVLSLVTLQGKDLRSLLEYVAGSGGLPISGNIRMVIDHDNNLLSATVNGEEIDNDKVYNVATIDYLVNLGRYGLENLITRRDDTEIIRDYFVEYYRKIAEENNGMIEASLDGRITVR